MEFREGHWANLVYISTLGESKSLEEVAEAWNVERDELDEDRIRREAERLEQVSFFEETGENFLAKTDSQAFKTEVENYFRHESGRAVTRAEIELFTGIVGELEIRKKVFGIESVTQFYYRDPEEAKKNPLAVFEGLLFALDQVLGHDRDVELGYNDEVLVDNLRILEKERPQILEKL